jgi:hypothetical protein
MPKLEGPHVLPLFSGGDKFSGVEKLEKGPNNYRTCPEESQSGIPKSVPNDPVYSYRGISLGKCAWVCNADRPGLG